MAGEKARLRVGGPPQNPQRASRTARVSTTVITVPMIRQFGRANNAWAFANDPDVITEIRRRGEPFIQQLRRDSIAYEARANTIDLTGSPRVRRPFADIPLPPLPVGVRTRSSTAALAVPAGGNPGDPSDPGSGDDGNDDTESESGASIPAAKRLRLASSSSEPTPLQLEKLRQGDAALASARHAVLGSVPQESKSSSSSEHDSSSEDGTFVPLPALPHDSESSSSDDPSKQLLKKLREDARRQDKAAGKDVSPSPPLATRSQDAPVSPPAPLRQSDDVTVMATEDPSGMRASPSVSPAAAVRSLPAGASRSASKKQESRSVPSKKRKRASSKAAKSPAKPSPRKVAKSESRRKGNKHASRRRVHLPSTATDPSRYLPVARAQKIPCHRCLGLLASSTARIFSRDALCGVTSKGFKCTYCSDGSHACVRLDPVSVPEFDDLNVEREDLVNTVRLVGSVTPNNLEQADRLRDGFRLLLRRDQNRRVELGATSKLASTEATLRQTLRSVNTLVDTVRAVYENVRHGGILGHLRPLPRAEIFEEDSASDDAEDASADDTDVLLADVELESSDGDTEESDRDV
ncbi:MAG: hypothetical protein Q9198_001588 [Flavoplaca austrocitrina]